MMKSLLASTAAVVILAAPALAQPPQTGTLPTPKTEVTVETTVEQTPTATIETTTEVVTPVSDRPALDPENPIAPEVKALVASKPNYTTKDIVEAQLEAVLATPPAAPTTITTTTRTTPHASDQ